MDVGIKELKENLSKYLAVVKGGGSLTVTDRGVPVARIEPVPRDDPPEELRALIESGKLKWKGRTLSHPLPPPIRMLPGDKDSTDYVREQRR